MTGVNGAVADAIKKRRQELGYDVAGFIEATGLTRQGLRPLLAGEQRKYQERLTLPVTRVLRWTPDSIDRLFAGQPPIEMGDRQGEGVELVTRLDALDAGQAELDRKLEALQATRSHAMDLMLARFEAMEERVDHLERLAERAHAALQDDSGESG